MFRFSHPYYFYLYLVIPAFVVLLILFILWRKRTLDRFGDHLLVLQLMPEQSPGKMIVKFILGMAALALIIFSLAGPQTGSKLEKVHSKGIDIFLALDVSNSMLAEDIRPNRLERAKQAITKLIEKMEGDRIGIIVFAGKPYVQLPITTDYAAAKLFVSSINTNMIPVQGTAIASSIELASRSFGESKQNKAIVVITDGEDHEGSVLEQTEKAVNSGISVYSIGMGTPEGAPIPVYNGSIQIGYKKDHMGATVITKLDETLLQRMATMGKGMYVRATTSEVGLNSILDDLNKIQKAEIESRMFSDYEDQFQYFIAIALLILFLDLFIFERKTQWFKKIRPYLPVILIFFAFPVSAQKENKLIRQGNRLYEKGQYQEADKNYRKALELNKESVKGQFNLGDAVYQQKNWEESGKIFENLTQKELDNETRSKIFHNLGNSLLEAKQYDKSILAYKNALLNNPSDKDTKYNLEYAKMMLKKQQQQQQQKKDQQKQDQKDKQDQQKDQQKDQQNQQPKQNKISKEDAERMLEALKNDEKKTMEKLKKAKAVPQQSGVIKDW